MGALSDVLTGNHQLWDIAEMSDGLVYVTSTAGFYRLSGEVALTEIARLEGCALSAVTSDVEAVAAPAGSAADAVAYYLHPDGWALAWNSGPGALTELWRYSAGAWSLAAVGATGEPTGLFVVGGEPYISAGAATWSLRGSVLADVTATMPALAQQYAVARAAGNSTPCPFRGAWCNAEIDAGADQLMVWRAGAEAECIASPPLGVDVAGFAEYGLPVAFGDGARLHVFCNPYRDGFYPRAGWFILSGFTGRYDEYMSMESDDDAIIPSIRGGHATGARVWATGSLHWEETDTYVVPVGGWALFRDSVAPQGFGYEVSVDGVVSSGRKVVFLIHAADLAVHDLTLEWAALDHPPTVEAVTLESATGAGLSMPTIGDLTIEWGAGLGAAVPSVEDLSVESMAQARPMVADLSVEWGSPVQSYATAEALTVEWATGAGAALPSVQDLTIEWGAGSGAALPSVEDLAILWSLGERGRPVVGAAVLEWARYNGPNVGEGEGVLWLTVDDDERPAVAVRVVTDWDMADEAGLRCLVRADGEALDVDAWGSYQAFKPGADTYLEQPGHHLRVGIIGPLAQDPPHVRVDVLRVDE